MQYERAYASMCGIVNYVKERRREDEDRARNSGDVIPDFYEFLLDDLESVKQSYREKSDQLYQLHKIVSPGLNRDGVTTLANNVVMSAIEDYEKAVSSRRETAVGMRKAIRRFAEHEAGFWTTADVTAILAKIDKAYKKFQKVAVDNVDGICEITERFQKQKHRWMSDKENPYRCPLDDGGLYVRHKNRESGAVTIGCTHCELTVEI